MEGLRTSAHHNFSNNVIAADGNNNYDANVVDANDDKTMLMIMTKTTVKKTSTKPRIPLL